MLAVKRFLSCSVFTFLFIKVDFQSAQMSSEFRALLTRLQPSGAEDQYDPPPLGKHLQIRAINSARSRMRIARRVRV